MIEKSGHATAAEDHEPDLDNNTTKAYTKPVFDAQQNACLTPFETWPDQHIA